MAARGDSEETQDGETYIEKYTRGVLEVENILSLEKLRQVSMHLSPCGECSATLSSTVNDSCKHALFFSPVGCDGEGSAQHQGQAPQEEYQHTKCTACNDSNAYCTAHQTTWEPLFDTYLTDSSLFSCSIGFM